MRCDVQIFEHRLAPGYGVTLRPGLRWALLAHGAAGTRVVRLAAETWLLWPRILCSDVRAEPARKPVCRRALCADGSSAAVELRYAYCPVSQLGRELVSATVLTARRAQESRRAGRAQTGICASIWVSCLRRPGYCAAESCALLRVGCRLCF